MTAQVREIMPQQVAELLETGADIQILDVRPPELVAAGRIDIIPAERFHNVVGSKAVRPDNLAAVGLDRSIPVIVVCGHGNDSRTVAARLSGLGYDARSMAGGMAAWMDVLIPRELPPTRTLDRLVQFDRVGKGSLGYLLVSEDHALIIDPPRRFDAYLRTVEDAGCRLVAVADTHIHADYISGAAALSRQKGVPYYLHPGDAVYPYDGTPGVTEFSPMIGGMAVKFGRATVLAMHTPGHTEGSITYLVDDQAAFTGDFLFVDSIGRPDLAGKTKEWAALLWKSIQATRQQIKPDITVYPAHYSSESERRPDRSVGAALGDLLRRNEMLQVADEQSFLTWVESRESPAPEAYRKIKAINIGLVGVTEEEASELESGKHVCALGGRPGEE